MSDNPLADYDPMKDHAGPKAAWWLMVRMARRARIPVEVEVEYHPPSEHAGRHARLSYDSVTAIRSAKNGCSPRHAGRRQV